MSREALTGTLTLRQAYKKKKSKKCNGEKGFFHPTSASSPSREGLSPSNSPPKKEQKRKTKHPSSRKRTVEGKLRRTVV